MELFGYDGKPFSYYKPCEINDIIDKLDRDTKTYKGVKYYQFPCAFDIETTNYMDNGEPRGFMYVWQFSIDGNVVIGRTWEEFTSMISDLTRRLFLHDKRRVICGVHNLAYEFQFMRKHFKWQKVFSIANRKPIYAISIDGIEFRCTYLNTGTSLEKVGERVGISKLSGADYDYTKMRTPDTSLSDMELAYCINDVLIIDKYLKNETITEGNIAKIPLTKTGYVRRDCKAACYGTDHKTKQCRDYMRLMKALTIEPVEYELLKSAFSGGFTHANPFHVGKVLHDVDSYDFTSSYPTRIIANKFPMSKGRRYDFTTKEDFLRTIKLYHAVFEIRFYKLRDKIHFDNPLSLSKCSIHDNVIVNNGRVVSADKIQTVITNIDFEIFSRCYSWKHFEIGKCFIYERDYLPTDFVKETIKYYKGKTELKGIEGKEKEYLSLKENLNSLYGMMVTDPLREMIIYDDGWQESEKPNITEAIEKYNNSHNRFTFYPWGVFVTAFSRRELWKGIFECRGDYVYSDTDSIKILNGNVHRKWIDEYNKNIITQIYKALDHHGILHSDVAPLNNKGVACPIGVWDYEGHYTRFKTLGAKRYMIEKENGSHSLTVSGLNKKTAVPYLESLGGDIFGYFKDSLIVPPTHSGRTVIAYFDEPTDGYINGYHWKELTSSNISNTTYSMNMYKPYLLYLAGVREFYTSDGHALLMEV